jgi:hypothetical protein
MCRCWSVDAKSPMHALSVVGVWVFEFLANHRPPGSYPKTGVVSGLATILPQLDLSSNSSGDVHGRS